MESLDNIIEEINKFDINIVNIDNVNQIFKKLDSIISICEDKILSCANKIDNEDSNVTVEVNNEVMTAWLDMRSFCFLSYKIENWKCGGDIWILHCYLERLDLSAIKM